MTETSDGFIFLSSIFLSVIRRFSESAEGLKETLIEYDKDIEEARIDGNRINRARYACDVVGFIARDYAKENF